MSMRSSAAMQVSQQAYGRNAQMSVATADACGRAIGRALYAAPAGSRYPYSSVPTGAAPGAAGRSSSLDQGPIPSRQGAAYGFVVGTVLDVLSARHVAFCLECVVRRTGLRTDSVIREIDAIPLRAADGRCGGCGEAGPVYARTPG